MDWKDTVINVSVLQGLVGKYYKECDASNPPKTYLAMEVAELVAIAQAEPSFKAGIGEVVRRILNGKGD